MRVSAAFSRLLRLDGVWVRQVQFNADRVVVWVALRRRRLACPRCAYLTLVTDHQRGCVVWGTEGNGQAAGDRFFTDLGPDRSAELEAISMDMGPGYAKSARKPGHAPQATLCIDNFHVAALATKALDEVRRD